MGTRSSQKSESWFKPTPKMTSRTPRGIVPRVERRHSGSGLECPALLASSKPETGVISTPGSSAGTMSTALRVVPLILFLTESRYLLVSIESQCRVALNPLM